MSRKAKIIKPCVWESCGERTVYIERTNEGDFMPTWDVWTKETGGEKLGSVQRFEGSIDTKIAGTRLRRQGRRRVLWSEKNQAWQEQYSMAAVIRRLLDEKVRRDREAAKKKESDPFKGKIHISLGGPEAASTVCGIDPKKVNTVGPKQAQHATCKRCIRGLHR